MSLVGQISGTVQGQTLEVVGEAKKNRFSIGMTGEQSTRIEEVTQKTLKEYAKALFKRSTQKPLWQQAGTMSVETFQQKFLQKQAEKKSLKSDLENMEVALKFLPQGSSEFKALEGKYFQHRAAFLALTGEVELLRGLAEDGRLGEVYSLTKEIQEASAKMKKVGVGKQIPDCTALLERIAALPKDIFNSPGGKVVGSAAQLLLTSLKNAEERVASQKKPFYRKREAFEERRRIASEALRGPRETLTGICTELKIPLTEAGPVRSVKQYKLQDVSKQLQKLGEKTQVFLLKVSTGPFKASVVNDKCYLKNQLDEIKKKCASLSTDVPSKQAFAFHRSVCEIGIESIEKQLNMVDSLLKKESKDIAEGFSKITSNIAKCSSGKGNQRALFLFSACQDLVRIEDLVTNMEPSDVQTLLQKRIATVRSTIEHLAKTVLQPTEKEERAATLLLRNGTTKDPKMCLEYITKTMTKAMFFGGRDQERAMTDCCLHLLGDRFKSDSLKKMREAYLRDEDAPWKDETAKAVSLVNDFRKELRAKTTEGSALRISELQEQALAMPKDSPFKPHIAKVMDALKEEGVLPLSGEQQRRIKTLLTPSTTFPFKNRDEINALLSILMTRGLYAATKGERGEARDLASKILDRYLSGNKEEVKADNDDINYMLDNMDELILTGIRDTAREEQQKSLQEASSIGMEFFPEEQRDVMEMSQDLTSRRILWTRFRSQSIRAAILTSVSELRKGSRVEKDLLTREDRNPEQNAYLLAAVRQHASKWMSA